MFSQNLALIPFGFAVLFAIYGGIEFGLPLLAFSRDQRVRPALKAAGRWEFTLVLLALAAASAWGLYPNAASALLTDIWAVFIIIVLLLIARAVMLAMTGARWLRGERSQIVLAVIGLALPALLMQIIVVLLTGDGYLTDHIELMVALGVAGMLTAVSVASGFFYQPGTIVREVARRSFLAAAVWWAVVVPLALVMNPTVLDGRSLFEVAWPAMVALGLSIVCLTWPDRRRYFLASSVLIVGMSIMLFRLVSPYAVRPLILLGLDGSHFLHRLPLHRACQHLGYPRARSKPIAVRA
jgi:cytochrome bd-type quinol oxidase subunit 2